MNRTQLTSAAVIQINPALFSNSIDQEVVVFHEDQGAYFGMNKVGSKIWELLKEPLAVSGLLQKLQAAFEVSEAQCAADVLPFLTHLLEKKLIEIAPPCP